jgi:Cytochrome c oxidase subunit IV
MCAGYFWFVSRRIDPRPEDRPDAEIVDGAGEIGFFSPGSYWPFGLALAAALAGLGVVFWMIWLIALGMAAVLAATGGLLFEYYSGSRRTAEH